ncbi:hypothetical protein ABCS02_28090 [Microbacterium sp. X-17]|uniref:hypothetical protein n=1 Tax=Microbacterium sp. X-17 TaxID=3144404 RepID=UPI0031F4CE58
MFHNQRRRQRAQEEAEAAGADFWVDTFSEPFRVQLGRYLYGNYHHSDAITILGRAQQLILDDEGLRSLTGARELNTAEDLARYLDSCPDAMVPTVIEAIGQSIDDYTRQVTQTSWQTNQIVKEQRDHYEEFVNERLLRHRIRYEFITGEMVEKNSLELHSEVVAPTLRLLGGRPGWEKVERAYQNALGELHGGSAPDAITDAGTALQEALEALGCKGNALGPLILDAKKRGLFASHDERLTRATEDVMQWVSADRSANGDAHHAISSSQEDAWLIVHIVGALIVRLANDSPRT